MRALSPDTFRPSFEGLLIPPVFIWRAYRSGLERMMAKVDGLLRVLIRAEVLIGRRSLSQVLSNEPTKTSAANWVIGPSHRQQGRRSGNARGSGRRAIASTDTRASTRLTQEMHHMRGKISRLGLPTSASTRAAQEVGIISERTDANSHDSWRPDRLYFLALPTTLFPRTDFAGSCSVE